jgi:C4-dicarboxylate-specific signal transduction histidine kinase
MPLHSDRLWGQGLVTEIQIEDVLPPISADRVQLQQVLSNLVQNAIDAMEHTCSARKLLSISARRRGAAEVHIEVRDTGCGMDEVQRAFDAFFTTKANGMGIGLSVCRFHH